VNYCSRVHSSITIMIITFFTGPPPPSLAALHAPFHQPPTSHCTLSAFFRGRTHRPSPGVPSDFCKGWCRPTTLRSTPLACALTISLRFPLQESAAVASRCALRSLLTSERPHLVGQQICTGAYLWPRRSEAQTGPFLSGSTCGYSTTLPPRSRPLPKQPFNPPLLQRSLSCRPSPPSLARPIAPMVAARSSTSSTYNLEAHIKDDPRTTPTHESFLRRNTMRPSQRSLLRPFTRTLPPITSTGSSVYLRSKFNPRQHMRT
jgi:hypothetical protein